MEKITYDELKDELRRPVSLELSDYRREREIMNNELLAKKKEFIEALKGGLGDEIVNQKPPVPEKIQLVREDSPSPLKKESKIIRFFTKIANIL